MKNFGVIKESLNNLLVGSIIKEDTEGKNIFKEYISQLNNDEILKSQYIVYNNIESKHFEDALDATEYIKENIEVLRKFDKKSIIESNKKLKSVLSKESDIDSDYKEKELHENITNLIFTPKKASNIDSIQESFSFIKNYLLNNKPEEVVTESVELPPSVLTKMALDKFNQRYDGIDEGEKKIIKSILNGDESDREQVYTDIVRECIDIVNSKLNESEDLDLKTKLLDVKDKILRMEYNSENYRTDIGKLYDLKKSIES
jgi:hypothetical protein